MTGGAVLSSRPPPSTSVERVFCERVDGDTVSQVKVLLSARYGRTNGRTEYRTRSGESRFADTHSLHGRSGCQEGDT